jgi:nucleoside-diphosphate-sugar epimerase
MHPTRDLTYVSDTVEGFIKIAETPGIEGNTYNIGTGKEISVGELADKIVQLIGGKIPVIFDPTRIRPTASEVARLICNSEKARKELGWTPKVSLEEGLRRTIEWIGDNLAAYRPDIYNI